MKVLVASSFVPFIRGGGRMIVDDLVRELSLAGHDAKALLLPFEGRVESTLDEFVAYRMLNVQAECDLLITLRPPAHLLQHDRKVIWFIHHLRGYFDLWGTPYAPVVLPESRATAFRKAIATADNTAFSEARAVFTNSGVVANRVRKYNGHEPTVLYPPIRRPGRFRNAGYGDEIVYFCRVEHHKRQHLAIEAMRHVRSPVRLSIYGTGQEENYLSMLRSLVERYGLQDRVSLHLGWQTELRKSRVLSRCLGALYIAYDEDSYGYPSIEAHQAGKPVISTTDGGGTAELIIDGHNGRMVEPDPRALADAMDRLYLDRAQTAQMGRNGRHRLDELGISWTHVVEQLTR